MSKSTPYLRLADNGTYYVHWTENRVASASQLARRLWLRRKGSSVSGS